MWMYSVYAINMSEQFNWFELLNAVATLEWASMHNSDVFWIGKLTGMLNQAFSHHEMLWSIFDVPEMR